MRILVILIILSFLCSGDYMRSGFNNAQERREIPLYCKNATSDDAWVRDIKSTQSDSLIDFLIYKSPAKNSCTLSPDNHIQHSLHVNEVDK
jgi:hypothetical protein